MRAGSRTYSSTVLVLTMLSIDSALPLPSIFGKHETGLSLCDRFDHRRQRQALEGGHRVGNGAQQKVSYFFTCSRPAWMRVSVIQHLIHRCCVHGPGTLWLSFQRSETKEQKRHFDGEHLPPRL